MRWNVIEFTRCSVVFFISLCVTSANELNETGIEQEVSSASDDSQLIFFLRSIEMLAFKISP